MAASVLDKYRSIVLAIKKLLCRFSLKLHQKHFNLNEMTLKLCKKNLAHMDLFNFIRN